MNGGKTEGGGNMSLFEPKGESKAGTRYFRTQQRFLLEHAWDARSGIHVLDVIRMHKRKKVPVRKYISAQVKLMDQNEEQITARARSGE